ncbi:MAG: chloride channel protein [Planctomycetes bacterium]|nr:chloride channel protein [Planctomycetota bacterium]
MAEMVGYVSGDPKPGHHHDLQPIKGSLQAFSPYMLIMLLVGGGFISAWIRQRWCRENPLQGTAMAVNAFHDHRGLMDVRSWGTRLLATIVTLVSGGSAGREGPIVMAGAGCGSLLGQRLKLSRRDRRILLIAGMAGGIAAVFRAPLAGTLFAAEVLYSESDLEADSIIPGFIAAVTAFCVFGLIESALIGQGGTGLFIIPHDMEFAASDMLQLGAYACIALLVTVMMSVFRRLHTWVERMFLSLPIPDLCKPACGMLIVGLLAIVLWSSISSNMSIHHDAHASLAVLGSGYGFIQETFNMSNIDPQQSMYVVAVLLIVAVGKMLTSVFTIGSGGSGGLFGPSMVIGGCLGGSIGFLLPSLSLGVFAPPPAACMVMGMASALTVSFKTPLAALIMVSELTGGYELLLPAMWVCSLSFMFGGRRGLVPTQVPSQMHSSAHRGHFFTDVLAGIRVDKVFQKDREVHVLHPESTLDDCKKLVTDTHQNVYPVVDNDDRLTGIFSMNDLRAFLYDESLGLVMVAQDIATTDIVSIRMEDSLATTMRRFTELNVEDLPIVRTCEESNLDSFVGLLSRREVISHYNKVVEEMRTMRKEEGYDDTGVVRVDRTES